MKPQYWRIDQVATNTHVLGVRSLGDVCLEDDDDDHSQIEVCVRWDGCMHVTDERPETYHLCDMDEEIARWQELKALALAYFGGEFGIGGVSDEERERFVMEHFSVEGSIEGAEMLASSAQLAGDEESETDDE